MNTFVIPSGPGFDLLRATGTWNAVSASTVWGCLVDAVLGDRSGAVVEEEELIRLFWIIPAGGADDWPVPAATRLQSHTAGDIVPVPSLGNTLGGVFWRGMPNGRLVTDPDDLRAAIEQVIGPLGEAVHLGPIVVCCRCGKLVREAVEVAEMASASGSGWTRYACPACAHPDDPAQLRAAVYGPRAAAPGGRSA